MFPTEIGITVNDLLVEYFSDVLDVGFTARMENSLDLIAAGESDWVPVLSDFWDRFSTDLERARRDMPEVERKPELLGRDCLKCGNALLVRVGRFGKFVGCSGYPECKHTEQLLESIDVLCPDCENDLVQCRTKKGRIFYGCSAYPRCEWKSWSRPLGVACRKCGGMLLAKGRDKVVCNSCGSLWRTEELYAEVKV